MFVNRKIIKKVGIIGIVSNIFLLGVKITGGIVFKSQGLIADSVNSFGDIFASAFTYIGGIISGKPKDENHNFGHSKAEYVATFLIGIFMIIAGLNTIYKGYKSIINKEKIIFSPIIIIIPIITIVAKLILYFYTNSEGKKTKNNLILANSKDHRNDIFISLGVLVGIIFGMGGYSFVDGIVGMLISIVIILTGIGITKSVFDLLIDKSIDINISKEIKEKIIEIDYINNVDSIKSMLTGNGYMMLIEISVDPQMTVKNSHKITEKIYEKLKEYENVYDIIVHVNPDEEKILN